MVGIPLLLESLLFLVSYSNLKYYKKHWASITLRRKDGFMPAILFSRVPLEESKCLWRATVRLQRLNTSPRFLPSVCMVQEEEGRNAGRECSLQLTMLTRTLVSVWLPSSFTISTLSPLYGLTSVFYQSVREARPWKSLAFSLALSVRPSKLSGLLRFKGNHVSI